VHGLKTCHIVYSLFNIVFIKHVLNIVTSTRDSNPRLLTVREPAKSSNSRVNTHTRESGKPATRCKGAGFPWGGCGFPFLTHGLPVINPTASVLMKHQMVISSAILGAALSGLAVVFTHTYSRYMQDLKSQIPVVHVQ
jgi:hypothetical protein